MLTHIPQAWDDYQKQGLFQRIHPLPEGISLKGEFVGFNVSSRYIELVAVNQYFFYSPQLTHQNLQLLVLEISFS